MQCFHWKQPPRFLCSRRAPLTSHFTTSEQCHISFHNNVVKGWILTKLIFTASSRAFLSETGINFFIFYCKWLVVENTTSVVWFGSTAEICAKAASPLSQTAFATSLQSQHAYFIFMKIRGPRKPPVRDSGTPGGHILWTTNLGIFLFILQILTLCPGLHCPQSLFSFLP